MNPGAGDVLANWFAILVLGGTPLLARAVLARRRWWADWWAEQATRRQKLEEMWQEALREAKRQKYGRHLRDSSRSEQRSVRVLYWELASFYRDRLPTTDRTTRWAG